MSSPQLTPYFAAKLFAAYYNSPAYLDGKTIGILGTVIDNIVHFGTEGWKLKLWPIQKLQPEHARRILEMEKEMDFTGYDIKVVNYPDDSFLTITALLGGVPLFAYDMTYGNKGKFTTSQMEYLRGFHYDMGFSWIGSLIEAGLAVDASLLKEGPFWASAPSPRNFRHDYLDGLALLEKYAAAAQSPEHIGILNALIGAEIGGNTAELFFGMGDIIRKLRRDSDNENQRINN